MLEIKFEFKDNKDKMEVMNMLHKSFAGDKAYIKNSVLLNCEEDNTGYLQICTYNHDTDVQLVLNMRDVNVSGGEICMEN
jgi:hypothetical protein